MTGGVFPAAQEEPRRKTDCREGETLVDPRNRSNPAVRAVATVDDYLIAASLALHESSTHLSGSTRHTSASPGANAVSARRISAVLSQSSASCRNRSLSNEPATASASRRACSARARHKATRAFSIHLFSLRAKFPPPFHRQGAAREFSQSPPDDYATIKAPDGSCWASSPRAWSHRPASRPPGIPPLRSE